MKPQEQTGSKGWKDWASGGLSGICASAIALLLLLTPVGYDLVVLSYDFWFPFRKAPQPEEALLVYMDEESHKILGQKFGTLWDRYYHADLVENLSRAGAEAVVFDVTFEAPFEDPEADRAFAEAMQKHGTVVLGMEVGSNLVLPYELFEKSAAGIGMVGQQQRGLVVRELLPSNKLEDSDAFVHSLAWEAARKVGAEVTKSEAQNRPGKYLNYYGPRGTLPAVPYHEALLPETFEEGGLKGRTVFVGQFLTTNVSGARKDEFGTPYTRVGRGLTPGMEIQATAYVNLARGEWLVRFPFWLEACLAVFGGLGLGVASARMKPGFTALLSFAAIVAVVLAGWIFFRHQQVWFAWCVFVAEIVFLLVWSVVYDGYRAHLQKKILEQSLSFHISPGRVRQILKNPEELEPKSEQQEVSFLFSDIEDFSTIADRTAPATLFKQLNAYYEETVSCVHEEEGTVMQLIGDAIFAIWNAPEPQDNHQELACRAALKMQERLRNFKSGNTRYEFNTRIGIHTGQASVGNLGSRERFDYAAIGAETNRAARLEGLNKYFGTGILASDNLLSKVRAGKFVSRPLGQVKVKGADVYMEIHELIDLAENLPEEPPLLAEFGAALKLFNQGEFEGARAGFERALEIVPDDGPSRFYLNWIDYFAANPPSPKWRGEIDLEAK